MTDYSGVRAEVVTLQPGTVENFSENFFSIGLFEVGDCKSCAYSWLCCWCAKAEARTYLDGSGCLYNLFCMDLAPLRLFTRTEKYLFSQ